MFRIKAIVAAVATASLMTLSTSALSNEICAEVASKEQAQVLLEKLFDNAAIISADPLRLSVSTSCLLEVELMTDAENPLTKGTIYVLPDGDHFLNGPLMSKRSKVQPLEVEQEAVPRKTATATPSTTPSASTESQPKPSTPEEIRYNTLRKLQETPYVHFNFMDNPNGTANILYDVACPYCIQQYKAMEEAGKEHGINFNWIPVYLTKSNWPAAALIIRETAKDPAAGKKLLNEFMEQKVSNESLASEYKTLTKSDFEKARKTNMIFAEIMREAQVGTPLAFVENSKGQVKVASGKLDLDEWTVMIADD